MLVVGGNGSMIGVNGSVVDIFRNGPMVHWKLNCFYSWCEWCYGDVENGSHGWWLGFNSG